MRSLPITNSMMGAFFISGLIIIVTLIVKSSLKTVPGTLQNIVEIFYEKGFEFVESTIGSRKKAEKVSD